MKSVLILSMLVAGLLVPRASAQGPVSEYYVTAGEQRNIHVVQGEEVVRSWRGVSGTREYPIVVLDDVRTLGGLGGDVGARYDLDGNDQGDRYSFPEEVGLAADGTTDGESNYVVDWRSGGVWKFDRDWANGAKIFDTAQFYLGITYDPTDDTLWISQFDGPMVEHRDMDGNVLSRFDAGFSLISCLALDHADGTLWMGTQGNQGTFTQFDKDGTKLGSVTYGALADQNTLGGEFALGGGGKCNYKIAKSKPKRGCESCPSKGDGYESQAECEEAKDCRKKVKTTIGCPDGPGKCKIKAKKRKCE